MTSGAVRHRCNAAAAFFAASLMFAVIFVIWAPTAGAASRPKPDLVVRGFEFKSTAPHESNSVAHAVLESDKRGSFGLVYKIKNVGKRTAHKSTVRIVVNDHKVGEVQIGAIAPGRAITVRKGLQPEVCRPRKVHGLRVRGLRGPEESRPGSQ